MTSLPRNLKPLRPLLPALGSVVFGLHSGPVQANPQGLNVLQGSATTAQQGTQFSVKVSANAFLDWSSFNIGTGETTSFLQPSARSVVWNRINDSSPSQILGHLNANGNVVLYNQNGFFFGPGSIIHAGGFIATSANLVPQSFGAGGLWQYAGTPPLASIINYGKIEAGPRGSIFLISQKIQNHGILSSPDGTIGLYAGKEVLLSERPDGRGLSARVQLPEGSIDNTGSLIADAGTIALHAQIVNQNGLVQADSIRQHHGIIKLVAADAIHLGPESILSAKGDSSIASDAGTISIHSAGAFSDTPNSHIVVGGGAAGGNGGFVEISAQRMEEIHSRISGESHGSGIGGRLFIDPTDIIVGSSGANGSLLDPAPPDTLRLDVNSSFLGFSQITLQATRDISIGNFTTWNLNDSTGVSAPGSLLSLEAGRNITFGNSSRLIAGQGWSVKMRAGDLASLATPVQGQGGIYFNGGFSSDGSRLANSGSLETADGSIDLGAENEVLLAGGFIRTSGGGAIHVQTRHGNIEAGTKTDGFIFSRRGYSISPNGLGGIATGAGGNINLEAGGDILSFLPVSGSYGSGNVNLSADGRVLGKYQVRNGIGTIHAGIDVGSGASPLSLALITGQWNVSAGRDIILNEVYNPNGSLNGNRLAVSPKIPFQFDYNLQSSVTLAAGNSVQLLGNAPVHASDNPDRPPIYPPKLDVSAGPGGVTLGNDLILFPSPAAALKIVTTGGGSFKSTPDNSFRLIMSDSENPAYTSYIDQHSAVPLQSPYASVPVRVSVSGSIKDIRMQIPKRTLIDIAGDALNFFFTGQNLLAGDESRILIGGDLKNRSNLTSESLPSAPDFSIFDPHVYTRPDLNIESRLSYNETTRKLIFRGRMTVDERDFLLHPVIFVLDTADKPLLDDNGRPITTIGHFSDSKVIQQLFQDSQDVPAFPTSNGGFLLGGPGLFTFAARNLDLGITAGIRSIVTALNHALAKGADGHLTPGANLNITVGGNLDMISSQIASFNGGSINLTAVGKINVGSQEQFTSDDTPKGIYTGSGGNVNVTAGGDITVNGSRIASYDGGNVNVISTAGSIDAGQGAKGFFTIATQQLNPVTGLVETRNDRFFGSGILALTRPSSHAQVGNILVKAAQNILANAGGILQLAFNHTSGQDAATLNLIAGGNIEANQSGVLGANVSLKAAGNISGLVVANQNLNIDAVKNVSVTALASGGVTVKSGESVSGTIVGGGNVSVAGGDVSASIISTGGNASANDSATKANAFHNVAAPAAQQSAPDAEKTVADAKPKVDESDDQKKRDSKKPALARSTGRVTVILPEK